jgi:hypothetical protein
MKTIVALWIAALLLAPTARADTTQDNVYFNQLESHGVSMWMVSVDRCY